MSHSERPPSVTLENWDLGGAPSQWAYRHMGDLVPTVEIPPGGRPTPLDEAPVAAIASFPVEAGVTLDQYLTAGPVSGMVVVWRGRIVLERYPRMAPADRHLLMSVSKVFTSALIGILEDRGLLHAGQPVDSIIPELSRAGWAGVAVQDVLDMASGIACLEDEGAYLDAMHPHYGFEASLGWRPRTAGGTVSAYEYVAGLASQRPPGQVYEYTSVNTFVLSWIVERVAAMPFAEVLRREIWERGGFEAPAQLCCSQEGAPASHGGISTTLRDLARFGMLFTPSAVRMAGSEVITAAHLGRIQEGARRPLHRPGPSNPPDGMVAAFGQTLPPASRQWNFVMEDGDLSRVASVATPLYFTQPRPGHRVHGDPERRRVVEPAPVVQPPPGTGHGLRREESAKWPLSPGIRGGPGGPASRLVAASVAGHERKPPLVR